ncbi:MAG: hypothetical protein H0V89_07105, partial [Deltaproteobacteria bacterium]|nr:hypothetical protein [Deltaproteobacteria bacterium]
MLLLALAACTAESPGIASPQADLPAIDRERVLDHTAAVLSVGPRLVATPGEEAAAEIIAARLADTGLEVRDHWFTFDAWRPGTATITVGTEVRPVRALSPTPLGAIDGPLAEPGAAGTVGVYSSWDASRAEQFLTALFEDCSAFVRVTEWTGPDDEDLVEVGHTLEGSSLPGIAIGAGDGAWLREHLGEPVRLDV